MEEEIIYYHSISEDVRKYLRQTGITKGLISLLAMLYSAAEDISKEEANKPTNEKEKK